MLLKSRSFQKYKKKICFLAHVKNFNSQMSGKITTLIRIYSTFSHGLSPVLNFKIFEFKFYNEKLLNPEFITTYYYQQYFGTIKFVRTYCIVRNTDKALLSVILTFCLIWRQCPTEFDEIFAKIF